MKYKIHEKYEGEAFWTRPDPPPGYKRVRNCGNCGKMSIATTYPETKLLCEEVTEFQGVYEETGIPRGYSRQPFYGHDTMTCDEHKFRHEMEDEE